MGRRASIDETRGKVDLLHAFDTTQSSGTLAYYDPCQEEFFVRGTTLDVAHRVTVAHEMTHVLRGQHFDLTKSRFSHLMPCV